jgi:hypothetical protein
MAIKPYDSPPVPLYTEKDHHFSLGKDGNTGQTMVDIASMMVAPTFKPSLMESTADKIEYVYPSHYGHPKTLEIVFIPKIGRGPVYYSSSNLLLDSGSRLSCLNALSLMISV